MAQQGGLSQATVPEACLLRLSTQAKEAPYNEAAAVAVQFSVTAEKAALGSLHAFCTFLGKVHETGPFSSWPSEEGERGSLAGPCSSVSCEGLTKEVNVNSVEEGCQLAALNFELNLTPFSFPATFCEQFVKETFTFTVVKTPESTPEGPQRKEAQTKAAAKPDGREKGSKKAGPPRSIIPPGESRTAEMPVAALLLLKDGESMQPPEGVQEALATIPGVVSLRIEVKAVTSLLSPALRHLLNPVWLLIRDARYLPSTSYYPQKSRARDASDGTTENPVAAAAATTAAGGGAGGAFVPGASSPAPTPETKGTQSESQLRGEPSIEPSYPTDGPPEYFARAHLLRKVLETEPRRATRILGSKRVAWDAGFLCFWGPSVEDQNELKDFIEERRLEVELLNTNDLTGMDQSNLYPDGPAGQFKSKGMGRPMLKQPKTGTGTTAKGRRATTKARSTGGNPDVASSQFPPNNTNAFPTGAEPMPLRPPHGVASFCLSALASCGATHLSICTDVLPVAGYVTRKEEGSEVVQLCRTTGPDFMGSGTQISIEIKLAEPLFQHISFSALPAGADPKQEGEVVSSSTCISISLPHQGINRLFLAAPLGSKVAAEAKKLEQEEEQSRHPLQGNHNNESEINGAAASEAGADVLTGFIIADGRSLYGVLEGLAGGRLALAAAVLLAAAKEDEGETSQILYNSRLRFSDRRYSVANLIQTIQLKAPLREIMTPMGLQGKNDSNSLLAFSGLSKVQMATLLSRAADLKCQDLFPTTAELKSLCQLNLQ